MKEKVLAILFTLTVIWVQGTLLFQNGLFDKQRNLVFYDYGMFRDVTVHLSLVGELLNRFPPTNFAGGGIPLKNYHYFFDVFLSIFARIPGLSLLDLYFRVTPIVLSIWLCTVIYFTTLQLTKKKIVAALAIFFTVFATSFGPMIPFIKTFFGWSHVTGAGNIFMTDQIFSMMVNPQGILSLIIYLSIFLSLGWYERSKKIISLILVTFLLGVSFGVKAYGGILFAPAAIFASLYFLFTKKDWKPFLSVSTGVIFMGLWFLYSIDSKVTGLSFAPFWILGRMMADIDRLNEPQLSSRFLIPVEFLLFLIGSLGLRVFGFLSINWKLSLSKIFLYLTGVFSLFLPLLFNQTSKAYEVIQFFPYFSLLTGILFSIWVSKKHWLIIFLFALLFLAFDKQEFDRRIFTSNEKIIIPKAEITAVDYIRKNTSPNAIFLLAPSGFNDDYLWFSALTWRRVVYAGRRFNQQIGAQIKESKFDYIFVSDTLDGSSAKISNQDNLKVVFEKDGAKIYKHD